MNLLRMSRGILHLLTAIALIAGVVLLVMGLVQTRWRVAEAENTKEFIRHEHGLWRDCEEQYKVDSDEPRNSKRCYISPNKKEKNSDHYIEDYERTTLALLAAASFAGLIAIILALGTSCTDVLKYRPALRYTGVVWCVFHVVAACLSLAGVVLFALKASIKADDLETISRHKLQDELGVDFWLAVYGTIIIGISMIFAIVCVVLMFLLSKGAYVYVRVPRDKAHLHTTAV